MPYTKSEKAQYDQQVKSPKVEIEAANKRLKDVQAKKKKSVNVAPYYNLEMVMEHINITMLYLNMSDMSLNILQTRNTAFLESAKKEFYKVLPLIEEIVGTEIDRPLVDNKESLKKIEQVTIRQILQLSQKILFVFETLIDKMGENNKFKWSFVDLYVRIATMIKNLINFSELEKYRDMRNPFFKDRTELIKLCKSTLEEAGKQARQKYEMTSLAPGEIKKAIDLVSVLRKINVLFGEAEDAQKNKTLIDALKARLEEEEKKKEKGSGFLKK
jgi:hypothetical protein